jgi:hypothetical protein
MKHINPLVFLLVLSLFPACKKNTCKITRYDLAYSYLVNKNGVNEFSITIWKIPPAPSSPIPTDVADSISKLKSLGYELVVPPSNYVVYEYADCDECEKLKNSNVKHECIERK